MIDALLCHLGVLLTGGAAATEHPRGIAIHGPPGSGKSYLADVLATVTAPSGFSPEALDIAAAVAGTPEAMAAFRLALSRATKHARHAPAGTAVVLLVLERAESLLPAFEDEDEQALQKQLDPHRAVSEQILAELRLWREEGLPAMVLVPWAATAPIPPELSGSGALELSFTLPAPLAFTQRRAVLEVCTRNLRLGDAAATLLDFEAGATAGFLPCDIAALCRAAALAAVHRATSSGANVAAVGVLADDFACAHEKTQPTLMRGVATAMRSRSHAVDAASGHEDAGLGMVAGQHHAVEMLRTHVVRPFRQLMTGDGEDNSPGATEPPVGILLEGAPGTGKTFVAMQLAAELQARVFAAAPADILAPQIGEAEKRLMRLFNSARKSAPSLIVIEDIDTIAPAGTGEASLIGGPPDEGSETHVACVLRAEIDAVRTGRLRRVPEAAVLVVATTCEGGRVAGWLRSPHRLPLTCRLWPWLGPGEVARLLGRGLHGRGPPEAVLLEIAEALCRACRGGEAAAASACCRAAAIHAVRRAAAGGAEAASGGSAKLEVSAEDLRGALRAVQRTF